MVQCVHKPGVWKEHSSLGTVCKLQFSTVSPLMVPCLPMVFPPDFLFSFSDYQVWAPLQTSIFQSMLLLQGSISVERMYAVVDLPKHCSTPGRAGILMFRSSCQPPALGAGHEPSQMWKDPPFLVWLGSVPQDSKKTA